MPSGQPGAPPTAAVPSASGTALPTLPQHRLPRLQPRRHQPPTAACHPHRRWRSPQRQQPRRRRQCHRHQGMRHRQLPRHPRRQPRPLRLRQPHRRRRGHNASSYAATEHATGGTRDVGGRSPAGSRSAASLGLLQRACRRHLRATDPHSHPPLPTGHPVRRDWLPHGGPGQPLGYASMKRLRFAEAP